MPSTFVPSPTTGSPAIQQQFINESGRIGTDIFRYAYDTSPWARVIKRGLWPDGMGDTISIMNYERALAGTTNGKGSWSNHRALGFSSANAAQTPSAIGIGRGLPDATVVQMTQRLRTYNLAWTAVESMRIDVRDSAFSFQFKEQMKQLFDGLTDAAMRVWSYRTREEYFRLCGNKVIIGTPEANSTNSLADISVTGAVDFSTLLGFTAPQLNMTGALPSGGFSTKHSVLTGGVLRDIYARLSRNGAGRNSGGLADGAPVYNLVCSPETSDYLIREAGTRNDLRWADAGQLLKPLGVTRSLAGFAHVLDHEVPRFTLALNGSVYDFTEVTPWAFQAGNIRVPITAAASANNGNATLLTVTNDADPITSTSNTGTRGIGVGTLVTIAPTTASDDEYSGSFRVLSIVSLTQLVIDKPFSDDMTGVLTNSNNGQAGWIENQAFHTAPYEMSYILHPDVMEALTRNSQTTLGSGTQFDPTTKIGDFNWNNIKNEVYNPDGTFGYFRGILEFASKPVKTQYGWAIIHRRPDPTVLAAPSVSVTSGLGLTA
jgi:hypothetical protein